ncbi:MAG: hypothetical protein A2X36_08705 [Elusimicrobia bacterium GWA2_69_24]|nr:MAG: hypothetical protein A2X36_08705 [Elusimicrobia bacterium GWA2_69_24]HBL18177.1 N-acetyltransferase [Elusimicrobiota bacterium]
MAELILLKRPSAEQIRQITALYRGEGWWDGEGEEPEVVARMVAGSLVFVAALEDGRIVGMGRAIGDGLSDAYIQDVAVEKGSRGKGLGSRIVRELAERLEAEGLTWIGLIAEGGSEPFYKSLGFGKMEGAVPMVRKRPWK